MRGLLTNLHNAHLRLRSVGVRRGSSTDVVQSVGPLRDGDVKIADDRHLLSHGYETLVTQQMLRIRFPPSV